jgi:hypothetical protein
MLGYWMYYYEAWVLPALMRQEKMQFAWNAAFKKYHENIWKVNHAFDRDLRYSAVSKNLLLEHINHTKPKVRHGQVSPSLRLLWSHIGWGCEGAKGVFNS